jgi:hypothetical protein
MLMVRNIHWKLKSNVYWRLEGKDILLVHETCILRLNSASARLFELILGIRANDTDISRQQADAPQQGIDELTKLLVSEGMIERTGVSLDPRGQQISHVQGYKRN